MSTGTANMMSQNGKAQPTNRIAPTGGSHSPLLNGMIMPERGRPRNS